MSQKKKTNKLVKIEWRDATVRSGWVYEGEYDPDVSDIVTVGWVVKDTTKVLSVTQSLVEGAWGNITTVPKAWIKKVTRL